MSVRFNKDARDVVAGADDMNYTAFSKTVQIDAPTCRNFDAREPMHEFLFEDMPAGIYLVKLIFTGDATTNQVAPMPANGGRASNLHTYMTILENLECVCYDTLLDRGVNPLATGLVYGWGMDMYVGGFMMVPKRGDVKFEFNYGNDAARRVYAQSIAIQFTFISRVPKDGIIDDTAK